MINLLPDDRKRNIRIARMNVVLIRYNVIILTILSLIFVVFGLFYLELNRNRSAATDNKGASQQMASSYSNDQTAIEEYARNLSTARYILDNSISYTTLISAITELLPSGVILDSINLQADNIGKQTTFLARSKSYAKAIELKDRFQNSKVFTNVFFTSVNETGDVSNGGASSSYPYAISINATIKKDFKR